VVPSISKVLISCAFSDQWAQGPGDLFPGNKGEDFNKFKQFVKRKENKFELRIKKVRSDNESGFRNSSIDKLCDDMGMKHEFSSKYTPQSNKLVFRNYGILIDMTRSRLSEYIVSDTFWDETINMTCHTDNRLYWHQLLNKTPNESLIGIKPNIAYFAFFACKYYILKKCTILSKFDNKYDQGF
jgi:transposase InsO family protein